MKTARLNRGRFAREKGRRFKASDAIDLDAMAKETVRARGGFKIPRYYFTMHELEKVGVRPFPGYERTPLGVYGYPLTEEYLKLLRNNALPYRQEAPNISILEIKEPQKCLVFARTKKGEENTAEYRAIYQATKSLKRERGRQFAYQLASKLRRAGYTSVYDPGLGVVHRNEPAQVCFLQPSAFSLVQSIPQSLVSAEREPSPLLQFFYAVRRNLSRDLRMKLPNVEAYREFSEEGAELKVGPYRIYASTSGAGNPLKLFVSAPDRYFSPSSGLILGTVLGRVLEVAEERGIPLKFLVAPYSIFQALRTDEDQELKSLGRSVYAVRSGPRTKKNQVVFKLKSALAGPGSVADIRFSPATSNSVKARVKMLVSDAAPLISYGEFSDEKLQSLQPRLRRRKPKKKGSAKKKVPKVSKAKKMKQYAFKKKMKKASKAWAQLKKEHGGKAPTSWPNFLHHFMKEDSPTAKANPEVKPGTTGHNRLRYYKKWKGILDGRFKECMHLPFGKERARCFLRGFTRQDMHEMVSFGAITQEDLSQWVQTAYPTQLDELEDQYDYWGDPQWELEYQRHMEDQARDAWTEWAERGWK